MAISSDDRAFVLNDRFGEYGDELHASVSGTQIRIECNDDCGDSETGLSRNAFAYLSLDEAEEFADWLKAICAQKRSEITSAG